MKNNALPYLVSLFLFAFFTGNAQQEKSPQFYLDTILQIAKESSIMKDSVDWSILEKEVYAKSKGATTIEAILPAVQHLLISLGDFHGRIWYNNLPHYGASKEWTPSDMDIPKDLLNLYYQGKVPFKSGMVGDEFGYIRIPGIKMGNDAERATEIRKAICDLEKKHHPTAWILDLRLNGGGTMYPMLSGVADLLGSNTVGYFLYPEKEQEEPWTLKNKEIYIDTFQITDYQIDLKGCDNNSLSEAKVAVLFGASTSSSGEVTTLAFQGRPNTISIGEPTAAYTTGVSWQPLGDNLVLQLTMNFYADRNKKLYTGNSILPDLHIRGGDDFEHLENDEKVKAAIRWFKK